MFSSVNLFFVLHLFTSALAATYQLDDSIQGREFLSKFNVESISDPTHGRVLVYSPSPYIIPQRLTLTHSNYVDSETAARQNLTYASDDHFVMRADSDTVLRDDDPGRNSVRLLSNKRYTTSVMV